MAANFAPWPFPPSIASRLQPELLPATAAAGSFSANIGAGLVTATGTQASLTVGQGFSVSAGEITAVGAPSALSLGVVAGFNVGAGGVTGFGTAAALAPTAPSIVIPTPGAFAPALSELGVDIWERLGLMTGELTVQHINSMRRSMNLTLVRWANNGLNLWEITNTALPLQAGVATYTLPTSLIEMLDTYRRVSSGGIATDIIMTPMSRNTYAALPYKAQPGAPIQYWFNRQIVPTVTLWPVPDSDAYSMPYYAWNQITDADPARGSTANLPYRFLEAFAACTASHLAMKWRPERAEKLKAYSDEVFVEAADEDHEAVTLTMAPDLGAYFA